MDQRRRGEGTLASLQAMLFLLCVCVCVGVGGWVGGTNLHVTTTTVLYVASDYGRACEAPRHIRRRGRENQS